MSAGSLRMSRSRRDLERGYARESKIMEFQEEKVEYSKARRNKGVVGWM